MSKYEYMKDYYKYTNWRYINEGNTHLGTFRSYKKGIWILLDDYCHRGFIYGMTFKEFFQISKDENYHTRVDMYWDTPHIAYCKTCNGAGKFDWIGRITTQPSFERIRHIYVGDKSKILQYDSDFFLKQHMFRPTKIFRGERICADCMGCGVYIGEDNIKNLKRRNVDE